MTFDATQIRAHAAAAYEQLPDARVWAFHVDTAPTSTEPVTLGAGEAAFVVPVFWAPSDLAFRHALHTVGDTGRAIIFTALHEHALPWDVRMRLPKCLLMPTDPWEAVRVRFSAASVLPTLRRQRALADALLAIDDDSVFKAAGGGALDDATAWDTLLSWLLGGAKSPAEVLDAAVPLRRRLAQLPTTVRDALPDALGVRSGRVGFAVAAFAARSSEPADTSLVAWAVVAEALQASTVAGGVGADVLGEARVRLKDVLQTEVDAAMTAELAHAARAWVDARMDAGDGPTAQRVVKAARSVLASRGLDALAIRSRLLPDGWAAACAALADAARAACAAGASDDVEARAEAVAAALSRVESHAWRRIDTAGATAAGAIARLAVRALRDDVSPDSATAAELARAQQVDGAEEDALRRVLDVRDAGGPHLADAAREVAATWRTRVAARNARFAAEVAAALGEGSVPAGMLAQERVLSEVVAPLVRTGKRVLLLVMDGMSATIARSLARDIIERFDTKAWIVASGGRAMPMLTVLPSITQVARTSLLAGEVRAGSQVDEKKLLGANADLLRAGARGSVVFHLADLRDASEVRAALADNKAAVIGCVVNAVDAQLDGAEQLHVRWSLDDVHPLPSLLAAARDGERVVVFTSDHGHVWEAGSVELPRGQQARHRAPGGELQPGEIVLRGPRVQAATGSPAVVVLHREDARYGGRKAGYHGGCTLQEAVAPLVLLSDDAPPLGSLQAVEWSLDPPAWLEMRGDTDTALARSHAPIDAAGVRAGDAGAAAPTVDARGQVGLFGESEAPVAPPSDETRALALEVSPIVEALLANAGFAAAVSRHLPSPRERAMLRDVVAALAQRGGRIAVRTLADALGVPARRVTGFVALASRVTNVDGYQALTVDRDEQVVVLDLERVCRQYGVEAP